MNETILKVENISKTLGKKQIIKNISFETFSGEIFGFLGPNGAGKTTTIKMILGLLQKDSGTISINGFDITNNFEKAQENVGGIVENPELYKYLSGMENLKQHARLFKGITKEKINNIVQVVGLSNRINEKVKRYSLGMKQRLGLAQCLLHDPKLLILDEPTNGLDPAGIVELRNILKQTSHKFGASVFVSSHLMSEMELLCDRVCIINDGTILGVKTVPELISESNNGITTIRFTVNNLAGAMEALKLPREAYGEITDSTFEIFVSSESEIGEINQKIVQAGVMILGMTKLEANLEDIFIKMTQVGGNQIV